MIKKNVLSIDIDYIMKPCIQEYNDLCRGYQNREEIWKKIREHLSEKNIKLSFDTDNLQRIFYVLTNAIQNIDKDNILFAKNHDEILKLLKKEKNETYTVFNIDHHHDIFYNDVSINNINNGKKGTLANWVWYLSQNFMLDNYIWLKNENSVPVMNNLLINTYIPFNYCETVDFIASNILDTKFDYLFVCLSPEWFPKEFEYLFDIMLDMCSNLKNKDYDFNRESEE